MNPKIFFALAFFVATALAGAQELPDTIPATQTEIDAPNEVKTDISEVPDTGAIPVIDIEEGLLDTIVFEDASREDLVEEVLDDQPVTMPQIAFLDIENNDDLSSFNMLDSIVADYRMFFIGENHVFRISNTQLQLKMLKYLYYTAGVRTMLLEFGYSSGWLMNEYIQTGDTNLARIFDDYAYPAWSEFVRNLAEFNLSLDTNDRIEIIGIDVERFNAIPLKVLALQIPGDAPIPDEISLGVESLISVVRYLDTEVVKEEEFDYFFSYRTYDIENHVQIFVEEYDSLRPYYKGFLDPESFKVFDSTMVTLRHHLVYEDYIDKQLAHGFIYREKYMYDQFRQILTKDPDGKFFAQFGRCHVGAEVQEEACSWHNFNSVASRINNSNDTTISGKVCSIGTFYPNSDSYTDESDEITALDDIVELADEEGLTLIEVVHDNDMFNQLRNMYDYIIINQNSPEDELSAEAEDAISELSDMWNPQAYFRLGFGYNEGIIDVSDLNNQLSITPLAESFSDKSQVFHIDYGYFQNNFYSLVHFNRMVPGVLMNEDEEVLRLSHWGTGMTVGFGDLTSSTGLTLNATVSYERMRLDVDESINSSSSGSSLFGQSLHSTYYRNAAVLGGYVGYHINLLKYLPIELYAGYNLDVSSPKWMQAGIMEAVEAETRLDGWYFGATFIILIPE